MCIRDRSYIIKTLEAEVGFPLLLRSRTGVQPTAECRRILPLLRDLEQRNRQLEQETADIRGLAVGTVSIASFPCISRFWLPAILRDFEEQYPAITVALRELSLIHIWFPSYRWARSTGR